jgi:4-methylaminobutanoate oxidase (formaldehyde-forming)
MQAREVRIGHAPVLALRVSYVGELGWELHMPTEYAAQVFEVLHRAGAPLGLTDVGYRAIESLRLEKRYLYWGADITPDYTPYEAGLGFCVALNKGDFIGADALMRARQEGPKRKMCCFTLDGKVSVFGGEAILRGGKVLGVTTSGGYGTTIGRSIAFGYLPAADAGHDDYEIEAFCDRFPAQRHDKPLYDPTRTRLLM